MKQWWQYGSHCLLLVMEEAYSGLGTRFAEVDGRSDEAVGASLSEPVEREGNIEEVGQFQDLSVSVAAMVVCLEVWNSKKSSAGLSWQAVSALPVSAFSTQDSSSSLSPSSLLFFMEATSVGRKADSYTVRT